MSVHARKPHMIGGRYPVNGKVKMMKAVKTSLGRAESTSLVGLTKKFFHVGDKFKLPLTQ
jgi:hypothetical protein